MLRPGRHAAALLIVASATVAACGGGSARPPERDCGVVVWARPASGASKLEVIGDFTGWASPGVPMFPGADGWRFAAIPLGPGEHGYLVVEDGEVRLDDLAPLTTFHAGREVSLVAVADCSVPAFAVDRVEVDAAGALSIEARFLARSGGPGLDVAAIDLRTETGAALAVDSADALTGVIRASARGLVRGKHRVTIAGADLDGRPAEAARASAWASPAQRRWGDGVLYQILIDRYRGDGGAPLAPPASPASRAGGTLDGVRAEIERGTFEALGVSALWLSPVYVNPAGARVGRDGHPSEAYHGYWPLDSRAVDPRIGGEAALSALVTAAHARGLSVVVDFVPNHVYEDNPRYRDHAGEAWFNTGEAGCVCGAPGCDWGAHLETCWFAPYLPDVRWQSDAAARVGIDDALFWSDRFDLDGLRIDAVPMMPRSATRRMAHAVRAADARPGASFVIGEIFTGPGPGGFDAIRRFLGARAWEGLDAAFDFPLMWAMRGALAGGGGGCPENSEATLRSQLEATWSELPSTVRVVLDGVNVDLGAIADLRGASGRIDFAGPATPDAPADNYCMTPLPDVAAACGETVGAPRWLLSDGYWAMLRPLSPGAHTLRIYGATHAGAPDEFVVDVTYDLDVQ